MPADCVMIGLTEWERHMHHICICGLVCDTKVELRQHIGLLTPRWPAQRCTEDHYDPNDKLDVAYWQARKDVAERVYRV